MLLPIYDRNPLRIIPYQLMTLSLIVVTVLVFFWQLQLAPSLAERAVLVYGLIPSVLFGTDQIEPGLAPIPPELSLLTSVFLHGDWWHLLGNMLFLWVFGDNIEDSMGHLRFVVFYLLCGIAAVLTHALMDPMSATPLIGASGAISGVLGAYLLLHPKVRVIVLVFYGIVLPLPLPAYFVLGGWIVLQVVNAYVGGVVPVDGGPSWWAHIGGFVAGALLILPMRRRGLKLLDRGRY